MAWNRNPGKGPQGGNQGPWNNPGPSGGGRKDETPPDLEALLRRSQDRLKRVLRGGGAPGGSAILVLLVIALLAWSASGFYQVGARQQGVVQRFGAYATTTPPGLNWHIPWPIETAIVVKTTETQKVLIGGSAADAARGASTDESLMLTGDRNFLEVKFVVVYDVPNSAAKDWLFNVKDPDVVVKTTAQSAMREVVGRGTFDQLQTGKRTATEEEVKELTQKALNAYKSGIRVLQVNLQSVDPPPKALEAARDVQTARQEKETMRNSAEAYQNKIIPTARGKAQRVIQEAQGYKQKVIADAQGESQRFVSIYEQYKKAPEVTRRRMYLETIESVLGGSNKIVIDRAAQGVVPYLPLSELTRNKEALTSNPPAGPIAPLGASLSQAQGAN